MCVCGGLGPLEVAYNNYYSNSPFLLFHHSYSYSSKFLKQPHQSVQNSCLFCKKKKHNFSILHTHFYKTPTSVYLFDHLFYLNNNISLIFYYIKQTTTHMAPSTFFFLCCEKKTDERATWRRERKKE